MSQLEDMKTLLDITGSDEDAKLTLELTHAARFIADRRLTWDLTDPSEPVPTVEHQYLGVQVELAIESYSKRGAEGEDYHTEAGIRRSYENGGIYSNATKNQILPKVRVITDVDEDSETE